MSKDANYRKIMQSAEWQRFALAAKVAAAWQCQECGRVCGTKRRGAKFYLEVHHIRPIEDAKTKEGPDGMEARAYDPKNIVVLCNVCHRAKHSRNQSIEKHQETEAKRAQRIHETKQNLGIQDALDF